MKTWELFFDIKDKQHDASGIEHPNLYYWELKKGIFYPTKKIDEDEYHFIVSEWMNEVGLPRLSLDEQNTDELDDEHYHKYYWLMDLYDEVVDVVRSRRMVFNMSIYFGRLKEIQNDLNEDYTRILDLTDDKEIHFAKFDDEDVDVDKLPMVTIEGSDYMVVNVDENGMSVIYGDNSFDEDESDLFQFTKIDSLNDKIILLEQMHKKALEMKPF